MTRRILSTAVMIVLTLALSACAGFVLVKGGDWGENEIVGADVVKEAGGEVHRIPFVAGYSTTELIEKMRNPSNPSRQE